MLRPRGKVGFGKCRVFLLSIILIAVLIASIILVSIQAMRVNKWDDYETFEKFHRVEYRNKMTFAQLLSLSLTHILMISSFIRHIDYKTKDCKRLGYGLAASVLSFLITVVLIALLRHPEK